MFMVKAGEAVDELINQCLPYLEPGDIIIDGGNCNFLDTNRRTKELKAKGFYFLRRWHFRRRRGSAPRPIYYARRQH